MIDFAGSVYDESQRLIIIVSDIIRTYQLDDGAGFEHESVDLYSLAEEVTERLQPEA